MRQDPEHDPSLSLLPVSRVTPRDVDWLWPGRLARGKLAILDGDPGLGKSLVALDLCARLSSGQPFPNETVGQEPAASLILNGEDTAEDIIQPRLRALGADAERVFVLRRKCESSRDPLRIPCHAAVLDWALERTAARLVVIDPIMAFLDRTIAAGSDQSVRRAMFVLASLAERHRCAILLIRHLTKARGFHALYRGGGSIGIVGACRSAWLTAANPDHPEQRILAQVKNNLATAQPSLSYAVLPPSAPNEQPTLQWLGPSHWTASQLLADAAQVPKRSPRARARDFLSAALANGPCASRELWAFAQEQRFASRTVKRAKHDLRIRAVRGSCAGQHLNYWHLPGQALPPNVEPDARAPNLEEWLAPLRTQYPSSNPLDEPVT